MVEETDVPRGPQGQKRPADAIGLAVLVARIAVGEVIEAPPKPEGSKAGGRARASKLPEAERREIARRAAAVRWKK